jgi:hypothetical protein
MTGLKFELEDCLTLCSTGEFKSEMSECTKSQDL